MSRHYEVFYLTLFAMLAILGLLITIYLRLGFGRQDASAAFRWFAQLPFSVYLGWITVATVAGAGFWWYQTADGVPELVNFSASSVFQGASTVDAEGPIGSLAVLPLDDLSADPGQEYFAPGMHEAIVSELSRIVQPPLQKADPLPLKKVGSQRTSKRSSRLSVSW